MEGGWQGANTLDHEVTSGQQERSWGLRGHPSRGAHQCWAAHLRTSCGRERNSAVASATGILGLKEQWIQEQCLLYYQEGFLEGQGYLEGTGTKARERTRLEGPGPLQQVTIQPF